MVNKVPFNVDKNSAVHVPTILIPGKQTDLSKWSVVACDQYTSQPEYWAEVEELVGDAESTLHLVFPEVYLEDSDNAERIKKINDTMMKYLDEKILVQEKPGFIYVDRKTTHVKSRKGLIISVDLEHYDYNEGSQTLIRATEGTVLDRLPPRIKIRENAPIELPHIMILIDDPSKSIIEPLANNINQFEKLYDFELMMEGSRIQGYKIENEEVISGILQAFDSLADPETFKSKYKVGDDKGVLLFAVGDGNHSLATAKACWENIKKTLPQEDLGTHPARYALVEVVNVHDEGINFEPIHRVVFNVDPKQMLDSMVEFYKCSADVCYKMYKTKEDMQQNLHCAKQNPGSHVIPFVTKDSFGAIIVKNPKYNLEVATLQCFLDEFIRTNTDAKIDYIHGDDVVDSLGQQEGNIGFYLPAMDKHDLFKTVILDGALPRKTFSMGEAEEKKYYLECRKIIK